MDYRIDRCIDLFGFSFIVKSSDIWKYRFYFCFYNTFILGFIDAINFRAKCFNAGDAEVSLFGEGQCSWQCSRFNIYHTVILFLEDRCYCSCFIVFECFDFYPVLYICPQNKDWEGRNNHYGYKSWRARYVEDGSVDQSSGYVGNISFLFHSYFHKSYGFYWWCRVVQCWVYNSQHICWIGIYGYGNRLLSPIVSDSFG